MGFVLTTVCLAILGNAGQSGAPFNSTFLLPGKTRERVEAALDSQILLDQSQDVAVSATGGDPVILGPRPRSDHAVVVTDRDSLFVFGGADKDRRALGDIWKFDFVLNTWSEQSPEGNTVRPSARFWHAMACGSDGTKLYVFGGFDLTNDLNDLWRYSTAQHQWIQIFPRTSLPLPRDRHSMVVHGQNIYMFGGYVGTYVNDLWQYSIVDNSWSEIVARDPPPRRRSHGAAMHGSRMFIFGGYNGDAYMSDLWEMDFVSHTWTEVRSSVRPAKRARASLAADHTGALFVFGGFDGNRYRADLWRHQDGLGWSKVTPDYDQPAGRADGVMVYQASLRASDKGRLFMFGGLGEGNVKLNDVFKYELASNQWREIVALSS